MSPWTRSRSFGGSAFLLAVLVTLPFLAGLGGDFIFDDRQTIVQNHALRSAFSSFSSLANAVYSYHAGHGSRALAMLTFAFDYWRGGADPSIFKTSNIVIHGITVLVAAVFFRTLLSLAGWKRHRADCVALAMAASWALHPLQVSSVLYVVQRMQTLGTLFLLLAMWAYAKTRLAQIENGRSRIFGVLTLLFWVFALASKEDSVLLPFYTLLMELTVLRFRAARPVMKKTLQAAYLAIAGSAVIGYALLVIPRYWHWDAYPGRSFSSAERLLTEGRVLAMYMGQILLPLPDHLRFYYDDFSVSPNLFDPPTTLPALVLVASIAALAWRLRSRRPLFALGALLFLAGHFVTSNVLNLELAFEHRNHFPLIGAVLALGDLAVAAYDRWIRRPTSAVFAMGVILVALGATTAVRARQWGDPLGFAEHAVHVTPKSQRAWTDLCTRYFDMDREAPGRHYIDKAIGTCTEGARQVQSPMLFFNVIVYKTLRGSPTQEDWLPFLNSLRQAPLGAETLSVYEAVLSNVRRGFRMDPAGTVQALTIIADRAPLTPQQYILIAAYIFNNGDHPEQALPYLERAVRMSPRDAPFVARLLRDLAAAGRDDWVARLEALPREAPPPPR